jgi:hypothetical protein
MAQMRLHGCELETPVFVGHPNRACAILNTTFASYNGMRGVMTTITFESVLAQARQLPLSEQVRLTSILERERAIHLSNLLDTWADDESSYEDETWPQLQAALDEERQRLGMRSLFDDTHHSA